MVSGVGGLLHFQQQWVRVLGLLALHLEFLFFDLVALIVSGLWVSDAALWRNE